MSSVRSTMGRRGAALAVVLVACFGVTSCTAGSSSGHGHATTATAGTSTTAPTLRVGGARTLAGTERSYGPSVGRIPGAVYQPDVVLIGGGADAIVGAQDNGLVWTVRGSAPGVSRLADGKIMVATSFATGRVEHLQPDHGNVQVTLAPVGLTDIFKTLHVASSAPVALQSPLAYSYAGSPSASTAGDQGTDANPTTTRPSVAPTAPAEPRFAAPVRLNPAQLDPSIPPGAPTVKLPDPELKPQAVHQGKFDLLPYCCYPSQGVHISYNEPAGRMAATVGIVMGSKPLVDFHIDIDFGGLEEAVFELNGPEAIEFQFDAATKDVSGDYKSPTLKVPIAFTFPIGAIPFTVELTQSVSASIQLAGQASFQSKGEYKITGGLGFAYRHGHFGATSPTFSSGISALHNAVSYSVGINALSIDYTAHLSIGIGVLGFNGGPFMDVDAKLAIDKDGSPPETSLKAGCADARVYVNATFGVGYTMPRSINNILNSFLKLVNASPIPPTGGLSWGPFTLWDPGLGQVCLKR